MESGLQIKTRCSPEADAEDEPVSPTGQYFNSKSLSVCILAVLETSVPIDDSGMLPLIRELFLPINPRFSSIMAYDKKGKRRWKKVEVNLQDHVTVPSFPESVSVDVYDDNFDKYLTKLSTKILPEDRPLWEIHILKYPTSKAAGHIIFKLHHALGDGYSLMGALLSCRIFLELSMVRHLISDGLFSKALALQMIRHQSGPEIRISLVTRSRYLLLHSPWINSNWVSSRVVLHV